MDLMRFVPRLVFRHSDHGLELAIFAEVVALVGLLCPVGPFGAVFFGTCKLL